MPTGGIVLGVRTVIVAGPAGLVVAVIAALSPARKAAKVPPVAAMQEVPAGSTGYGSKQRVMVGTAILLLGMAALFTGLFAHIGSAIMMTGAGVLLFGWALVRAMHSQGITAFSLPVLSLVIMVVLAGLAGVVAAILPSRHAAKLNIFHAIVSE